MRLGRVIASLSLALAATGCIHASPTSGHYYDRPRALYAEMRADAHACLGQVVGAQDETLRSSGAAVEAVADRIVNRAEAECMARKGYTRMAIRGEAGRALWAMTPEQRAKAVQALMDANDPLVTNESGVTNETVQADRRTNETVQADRRTATAQRRASPLEGRRLD